MSEQKREAIRGFSIPFRIDPATRSVVAASGVEKLEENIVHILLTGKGERVMRRDYGGGLRQLVHDPSNDALRAIVQHQIASSIGRWEPRVLLEEVTTRQEGAELVAEIRYLVRRTRERRSLSVPIGLGGL